MMAERASEAGTPYTRMVESVFMIPLFLGSRRSLFCLEMTTKERLPEQIEIQDHDNGGDQASNKGCQAVIDQCSHQVSSTREEDQGDECERNAKGEHDLADNQR